MATLLGLAGVAGLVVHCGSETSEFDEGEGPCATVYRGLCGAPCATDEQCPSGLHCANGACTAACASGSGCAPGTFCDPRGRCAPEGVIGPGGDPADGGGGGGDACVDFDLNFDKQEPTIVLLIDRSTSMDQAFPGGTRWTVLKDALLNDAGVLRTLNDHVRFGLTLYANGTPNPAGCPDLVSVPIAANNYNAIDAVYRPIGMIANTPTGESLLAVAGLGADGGVDGGLAGLDAGGPKIILLATDGDPDYCGNPLANDPPFDAGEVQRAKDITINAVQRAFDAGIQTYVIAVGDEVSEVHQQEVANAGLGYAPDAGDAAPYFRPSTQEELKANIRSIIFGARSCVFTMNGRVQAGKEAQGKVTLNGQPLTYNDPNGWKLRSPTELEILGTACDKVKDEPNVALSVSFPCGTVSSVR